MQGFLAERELEIFLSFETKTRHTNIVYPSNFNHHTVICQEEKWQQGISVQYPGLPPGIHQGNLRFIQSEKFTTEQSYSLEVTFSCPQQNGSQISETEKMDYLISFWKYIQVNELVEGKRLLRSCSLYRLKAEQELHKMSNQNVFYNAAKLGNDLQS